MKKESQETGATPEEERIKITHPIKAEEAFTLARDVYDVRSVIVGIYNNRAAIKRRLGVISLLLSILYTLFYVGYTIFGGFINKLTIGWEIALYSVLAAYAILCIALIVATLSARRVKAATAKARGLTLKIFRLIAKLISIGMAITAIVLSNGKSGAFEIINVVISVVIITLQAIPLFCGGVGALARWVLSPERRKLRFSAVITEWYELIISDEKKSTLTHDVDKKRHKHIAECIDKYFINQYIGTKYVDSVGVNDLLTILGTVEEKDLSTVEGILKNVFDYAQACAYITFNPCRDMGLKGSIDVIKKPSVFHKFGRYLGGKIFNGLAGSDED